AAATEQISGEQVAVEQSSAGARTVSNLGLYVEEGPSSQTAVPGREQGPLLITKPAERSHTGSREDDLVGAHEIPPVAIEQYRRLAGTLDELQAERGVRTLLVSSALPREGKTLTVTNLALTLSHSYRRKVLLIDADLRHPSVHEVFGLRNSTG